LSRTAAGTAGHDTDGERRTTGSDHDDEGPGAGPSPEVERRAPDQPTDPPKRSWGAMLRRTAKEFQDDELTDRAAALTYYAFLALFPGLLLVSVLGLAGRSATDQVLENTNRFAPGSARDILTTAVQDLQGQAGLGSAMALIGLLGALWSASGYVAAFIRASNSVYDIPEGRPVWKLTPLRLALTLVLLVMAVLSALIVVFT